MERPKYVYVKPNGRDLFFKAPNTGKLPLPRLDAPDFAIEYHKLLASVANGTASLPIKKTHRKHMAFGGEASVGALAVAYFASREFQSISQREIGRIRRQIELCLQTVHPTPTAEGERVPFADIAIDDVTTDVARDLRDALTYERRKGDRPLRRPGDLAHWRDVRMWRMRAMFNWGTDRPYRWVERDDNGRAIRKRAMTGNAFARLENLYVAGDGHKTWSDDDCDTFEAYCIGEHLWTDRLAFGLCRYAAVRRCDVVRLGPQHVQRDKEGNRTLVFKEWKGSRSATDRRTNKARTIPIVPELWEMIERAEAMSRATFIVGPRGAKCSEDTYGARFRKLAAKAGLPDGSTLHGIRKYVGTRMAEGGASPHQIAALLGHQDSKGNVSIKNVMVYSAKASLKKLTSQALDFVK